MKYTYTFIRQAYVTFSSKNADFKKQIKMKSGPS